MSSTGDETYLESVVEQCLPALPYQIKRNLELIQNLDQSCAADEDKLKALQESYILQAETKVLQLQVENEDGGPPMVKARPDATPLIPSTDELLEYTFDVDLMKRIQKLQGDCLQQVDEKVSVAQQAYDWVDAVVQRLDTDIAAMQEQLVLPQEAAQPNELAACQVTVGSEWILAKVLHHDPKTGFFKLADEDMESNKTFHLPESQVVVLRGVERLSKGDVVFAVYPDTTSFYQAAVVQGPRKNTPFCMVNFLDDSDEFGVTHDKAVSLQHIMLPPAGSGV